MSPRTDVARETVPSIKLDGALLAPRLLDDLLELRVARGVRTTGRATLTFVDRTFKVARSEFKLGAALMIESIEPAGSLFEGTITAVATEVDGEGVRATITAHDATYVLARSRSIATFAKQKPEDAVEAIAREAGLTATTPSTTENQEWFWRADSLLGQVDEICERHGWEWIVEKDKKLRCIDVSKLETPAATAILEFGEELLRFSAEQSRPTDTEVQVRGWSTAKKEPVAAKAKTPTETGGFRASADGVKPATSLVARRAVQTQAEAKAVAASVAAAAATVTARGRAHFSPLVQPGHAVTIKGAGPSDGTYYVREVEHVYDGGPMRTTFIAGFRPRTLMSDPWHSPSPGSSLLASGVHSGIVTNLNDPDKLGRVRVKLPSVSDTDELGWARVVAPGGGAQRGIQWLPEVNDEVLVAFEDGDARRPVVVGGLYSAKDKPPLAEDLSGNKNPKRVLISRKGHKIELSDGEGDAESYVDIVLASGKVRLHLGEDKIELETKDKPLRIASGRDEIAFDGNGTITIKASNIKLTAQQDITMNGTNVKAKATTEAVVEGMSAAVKANGSLKLQSSGIAELAGSVVKIN